MDFRMLGPLEVAAGDDQLSLGVPKQRALLGALVLHANEVVSRDRLIDELWGDAPPARAAKLVQHYVSGLRKVLPAGVLLTRAPGYLLRVEPAELDLAEFERLVEEAREAAREGDVGRSAELYRGALALWRGGTLENVAFEGPARREAAGIDDLRLAALVERVELELQLGRHAELVGELEALVELHPYQERLRGQLMLALYRSGRQAEALDAYQATRHLLDDELGLEPSQELQRLERAILQQDPSLELSTEARRSATTAAMTPHRKTVTIVVCVLTTPPSGDPEAFGKALSRAFAELSSSAAYHGGSAERLAGGELMAVFGVPEAHEDDAVRALRAAVRLQSALGGEVRIGVATGEVLADAVGVTGEALGDAARIAASAPPGEVHAAPETLALVGSGVDAEGPRVLAIADARPSFPERTEAPLVGRKAELDLLRGLFDSVVGERRCRVATVFGEAGIGKTRLVHELIARLGDDSTPLVGRCVSYGEGATYLPLREALQGIDPIATLAGVDDAELVARRLAELTGQAEGTGTSGEGFWAVRRVLGALARERPVLFVLEDVHWAEPTLLDLVEYLAAWSEGSPILVLCLARPELLDTRPAWSGATSPVESVVLEPLSAGDSEALVAALGEGLAADVRSRIAELAEGNPLYAEQLTAFTGDAGDEALASVPPTIEALLASRLDRLAADERAVLERAAIVGREFSHAAVAQLAPAPEAAGVGRQLLSLVRRGLVRPAPLPEAAGDSFRFHHVLVRDVAYAGLPKETRADLHERHADWLDGEEADDAIVGYHLEQAHRLRTELDAEDGRARRLAAAAGERLGAAGVRAWRVGDAPAAANLLGRARALLPAGHAARATTIRELGWALWAMGESERADASFAEAAESAAVAGDRPTELQARMDLAYRGLFSHPEGQADELLRLSAVAIPLFEALADELALGRTWLTVAYVHGGWHGHYGKALQAAERALGHYRAHGWVPAMCLRDTAAALYFGPTPVGAAVLRCGTLLDEADRGGAAGIQTYLGGLEAMAGRFAEARRTSAAARAMHEELAWTVPVFTTWAPVAAGIELLAGDVDAAVGTLRESCAALEEMGDRGSLAPQAGKLGALLAAQARPDDAERWARISEECAAPDDLPAQIAWRTARAGVLAQRGALAEAEVVSREAVRLAETTDAVNRRADAMLALAEVLRGAGRERDAAASVAGALALYERKENLAAAASARTLLGDPAPA